MARNFTFKEATRKGHTLKIALWGSSGAGKTYSALKMAYGLTNGGRVGVIDTENGSSGLYADIADNPSNTMENGWRFQALEFEPPYDPRDLTNLINQHSTEFDALVIDSASAFWNQSGGLMDIVDAAAKTARGNTMAGWKVGTPIQEELKEAFLRAKCHIILCMRAKTVFELGKDDKGRNKVDKLGLGPIQRDSTIYEMTIGAEINPDHSMTVIKSRCSDVDGKTYTTTGTNQKLEDFVTTINRWLGTAEAEKAEEEMEEDFKKNSEALAREFDMQATPVDKIDTPIPETHYEAIPETVVNVSTDSGTNKPEIVAEITALAKANLVDWKAFCADPSKGFVFNKLAELEDDVDRLVQVRDLFSAKVSSF